MSITIPTSCFGEVFWPKQRIAVEVLRPIAQFHENLAIAILPVRAGTGGPVVYGMTMFLFEARRSWFILMNQQSALLIEDLVKHVRNAYDALMLFGLADNQFSARAQIRSKRVENLQRFMSERWGVTELLFKCVLAGFFPPRTTEEEDLAIALNNRVGCERVGVPSVLHDTGVTAVRGRGPPDLFSPSPFVRNVRARTASPSVPRPPNPLTRQPTISATEALFRAAGLPGSQETEHSNSDADDEAEVVDMLT
jgi:hypothetical protein